MRADKQAAPEEFRKGQKTRQQILDVAADVASADGLEGLTIGSLAKVLGMSKSGLYAHFGSKEELATRFDFLRRRRCCESRIDRFFLRAALLNECDEGLRLFVGQILVRHFLLFIFIEELD